METRQSKQGQLGVETVDYGELTRKSMGKLMEGYGDLGTSVHMGPFQ